MLVVRLVLDVVLDERRKMVVESNLSGVRE